MSAFSTCHGTPVLCSVQSLASARRSSYHGGGGSHTQWRVLISVCGECVCVAVASVRCGWQRSSPFPHRSRLAQSGDPLLSQLPKDFLALLSEGASSNDLPRKLEARRRELRDLQDRSAVCRRARCDALHATREALARYCVTAQQQLRLRLARYVLMLALASHCASANSLSDHGTATINTRASLLWLSTSSC